MKSNKFKDRKRLFIVIMAAILILAMILSFIAPFAMAAETNNTGISMTANIGFSNKYVVGGQTPIEVTITNNGPDLAGELNVRIDYTQNYSGGYDYFTYYYPVEIAEGATKKVSFDATIPSIQKGFKMSFIDNRNNTVLSKNFYAAAFDPQDIFCGVLTDNPDSIKYLSGLKLVERMNGDGKKLMGRLIFLDKDTFPSKEATLKNFQLIIINDFNTSALSREQTAALEQFVTTGGTLVLGTGPNGSKVLSGLSSLVPAQEAGFYEITSFDNMIGSYGGNLSTLGSMYGLDLQFEEIDKQYVEEGKPTTTILKKGAGAVIVHHFDLSLSPISNWKSAADYLTDLYVNASDTLAMDFNTKMQIRDRMYYSPFYYMLSNIPSMNMTGVYVILGVLILYVFFVGPILYFILKAKDKREKGIVIIPSVALALTFSVYFVSANNSYTYPIVNQIAFYDFTKGSDIVTATVDIGVFTPDKGDVTLESDSYLAMSQYGNNNYYGGYYDPANRAHDTQLGKILASETTKITTFDSSPWSMKAYNKSVTKKLEGNFTGQLTINDKKVKGIITNNTDMSFSTVALMIGNKVYKYNQIASGGAIELDVDQTGSFNDPYMALEEAFGNVYNTSDIMKKIKAGELTKEDARNNYMCLQMIQNEFYSSYNQGFSLYAYGFSTDGTDNVNINVNGKPPTYFQTAMHKIPIQIDFTTLGDFELPYGFLSATVVGDGSKFDHQPSRSYLYTTADQTLSFHFQIPDGLRISAFQIDWPQQFDNKEIFNATTGEWEGFQKIEYGNGYIEDNIIRIRMDASSYVDVSYPSIRLKGGA